MRTTASSRSLSAIAGDPPSSLLALALGCAPVLAAHAQAGNDLAASAAEAGVDASIRPGDDFFAYANGAWLEAHRDPGGQGALERAQRDRRADPTAGRAAARRRRRRARRVAARKVADFRAAYLNEAAIEARGIAPLKPLLDRIDRVRDKAALTRLLGSELRADVDPLNWGIYDSSHVLGLSVEPGFHGEKTYVAFLLQGGLGLPDREHYVSAEPRMQALRAKYQAYIGARAGAGRLRSHGRTRGGRGRDGARNRHRAKPRHARSIGQRAQRRQSLDARRLRAPGAGHGLVRVLRGGGPAKQEDLRRLAAQRDQGRGGAGRVAAVAGMAGLSALSLIDRHADVLPRAFAESPWRFTALPSRPQPRPRAQRAIEATQQR